MGSTEIYRTINRLKGELKPQIEEVGLVVWTGPWFPPQCALTFLDHMLVGGCKAPLHERSVIELQLFIAINTEPPTPVIPKFTYEPKG